MRLTKNNALILSAIVGFLSIASNCDASLIATISPSSQNVTVGASPSVSVLLSNTPGTTNSVAAYQFDIMFNPAVLQAQSVTEQGFFATNGVFFFPGLIDNTGGTIMFIADTTSGGQTENPSTGDPLVNILFTAAAPGTSVVGVRNSIFLDGSSTGIPTTTVDGNIVVGSASAVPEPSSWLFLLTGVAVLIPVVSKRTGQQPGSSTRWL